MAWYQPWHNGEAGSPRPLDPTRDSAVTAVPSPATSAEARERLVGALRADLVGPFAEEEALPLPPSRWYLTGFLACAGDRAAPQVGPEDDDAALDDPALEDAALAAAETEESDDADPDPEPKRRGFFPSSIGVSLLLPPAVEGRTDRLVVTVSWADYRREALPPPQV